MKIQLLTILLPEIGVKRGDTWYDDVHTEHKVSKEILDIIIEIYSLNN